ncbi:phage integrase N-terminal SAM-like domain-containing protein [Billgrantia sp. Q4P2]|uniref:phage integrase N-terminal SAM-like domain-containing protein n=1 Tax=Billgrantia sp. Q4P2 TaxID=3463857 RepID=UPI0040565F31
MDRVKAIMKVKRYSPRTEKTYCYWIRYWIRYFIRFHDVPHPASMGGSEVRAFLVPRRGTPGEATGKK